MSNTDQCPSSKKQGLPALKPRAPRPVSQATGAVYYRGVEDLADSPQFREHLEREFQPGASELTAESRRDFLKMAGATLALAGAAGLGACRRPDHKILPYSKEPEEIIPGTFLYYASSMPLPGGGAHGLLVRTIDGRPIKLDGNPLHPITQGGSDPRTQAAILDLYDIDRLKAPARDGAPSTWDEFQSFAGQHFARFDRTGGAGLAFLVDKQSSPTRDALRERILARWPRARWTPYEPTDREGEIEGGWLAFGANYRQVSNLARAKVIASFGRDFLGCEGSLLEHRGFAAGRRVVGDDARQASMNRLYAVEPVLTLTGGNADHRLRAKPSEMLALVAALAQAVGVSGVRGPSLEGFQREFIDALAQDLLDNRGEAVVMAGAVVPAAGHALIHAINAALGAHGRIVQFVQAGQEETAPSREGMRALVGEMSAGNVDTLVVMGVNAVFSAPADANFAQAMSRVPTRIYHGLHPDETAHAAQWVLPQSHFLESWGDVRAEDGTLSPIQPMIAPLFQSRSQIELLAAIAGDPRPDGYELVRATWQRMMRTDGAGFEKGWRRALHDGVVPNTASRRETPAVATSTVTRAVNDAMNEPRGEGAIEIVFTPHPFLHDGRSANNAWLLETPHPVTKVTWDNPVLLSPATAKRLRISNQDRVRVTVDGRTMEAAAWILPGMADDTICVELGYGRTQGGELAKGRGFNGYAIRTSDAPVVAVGAIEKIGGSYRIATTQDHGSLEGRDILREVDLAAWRKHGNDIVESKDSYGNTRRLDFAGRLGMESHTPVNNDVYLPRQAHEYETVGPLNPAIKGRKSEAPHGGDPHQDLHVQGDVGNATGRRVPPASQGGQFWQQWGMSIDMTTCTGCSACVTACQAENNIPIVGKDDVLRGREMHWIRVDRYFGGHGATLDDPQVLVQPMLCVHCENAPCETVCPVNATVHGPEGTNNMAYNRCIGTRYCSNNCPYKVRRFNWFDYATKEYPAKWGQIAKGLDGEIATPSNGNWIPARAREMVNEVRRMQYNPHVTVRSRGVMEKCTYCIQRINEARSQSKVEGLPSIPDGYFETACQQACPTGAIVFGDVSDPQTRVSRLREHGRSYMVLDYLNTRPRTTHMVRLRNPNPRLRKPVEDPFHHAGEHGDLYHDDAHAPTDSGAHSRKDNDPGHKLSLRVLPADPGRRSAIKTVIAGALA